MIPARESEGVGRRMIAHVIDAAKPAAMAGNSIETYELSRTLGKAASDIQSAMEKDRLIYFNAFEKTGFLHGSLILR